MRVLMLAHNITDRGSAIRATSSARWLAHDGHEPTVVSARRRAGLEAICWRVDGVRLVEAPDLLPHRIRNGGLSPIDLAWRLAHVWREHYDVVHTFEPRPSATVPGLLAHRRGTVYVADWADLWGPEGMADLWPAPQRLTLGRFDGAWQAYTRRSADAVTVISSDLERRAQALGIPSERIRRVPVGANHDLFRPQPPAEARSRLGLPQDALVLAHTGYAPFDGGLLADTFA
jgi:glycosyltransferase involved in cell wall biosynthesis